MRLHPQQFERPLLQRRQGAHHRHPLFRRHLQLQFRHRQPAQMLQQILEAAQRLAAGQRLPRAILALARLGPLAPSALSSSTNSSGASRCSRA